MRAAEERERETERDGRKEGRKQGRTSDAGFFGMRGDGVCECFYAHCVSILRVRE